MRYLSALRRYWRAAPLVAVLAVMLAGFGTASTPPADAAGPNDWYIRSSDPYGSEVRSGTRIYHLQNITSGDVLGYGNRDYGINLVWQEPSGQTNIRFERQAGGGTVRYGDRVAIFVQGGSYIKYGERDNGINLVWSSTPAYDWEIVGGSPGQPVHADSPAVGLRNVTIQRMMVYGERSRGINLVWF